MGQVVYDLMRTNIDLGGFQVTRGAGSSGLAIDSPILKIAQSGPSFTWKRGVDGTECRSKTYNFGFDASLFCMKSNALTNGFLSGLIVADELQDNGASIVTMNVEDLGGTDLFASDECYCIQRPDLSKAAEDETVEWKFHGLWRVFIVGGNG